MDDEEKKWKMLVERARAPALRVRFLVELAVSIVMTTAFLGAGRKTGDYFGAYSVAACFLLMNLPLFLWLNWRRETALLGIIKLKAPELYRQMKDNKIA